MKTSKINNFNTSHVTVYPFIPTSKNSLPGDFNTSHVTVYRFAEEGIPLIVIFQYISCYCLSWQTFMIFLSILYFNTSHVTVYLNSSSNTNVRI